MNDAPVSPVGTLMSVFENFDSVGDYKQAARRQEVLTQEEANAFFRVVIKAAADFLEANPTDTSALVQRHLKYASQVQDPFAGSHQRDLFRDICAVCREYGQTEKQALMGNLKDLASLAGTTVKGLGYGTALAGAGTGALYWLLSRHARQGTAELEAMEQQAEAYRDLNRRIEQRLRDRYGSQYAQTSGQEIRA